MVEPLRWKFTQFYLVGGRHSEVDVWSEGSTPRRVLTGSGPVQKQCSQEVYLLAKLVEHVRSCLVISQLVVLIIFIKGVRRH